MTRPILVIGATGQVGHELMIRGKGTPPALVGVSHRELDIRDKAKVRSTLEGVAPAAVINVAAYTAVDKAETERALAFAVNRDGPANLANVCSALTLPLLHVSTDYVFDGQKRDAYEETDHASPLGAYGASKFEGEEAVRARLESHVILRTSWVFSGRGTNFVKTILRASATRRELRVVDDQRGCPTPASAVAKALLAIAAQAMHGPVAWGTYHFCGAPPTSWCGFAQAIVEAAAGPRAGRIMVTPIATAEYPTPARRPSNSVMSCAKIAAAFGISQPSWAASLPSIVAELLAEGSAE
ncbi:MAG TPA: dTDP-4-dehydrorhamnose reductase, partial [Alphaproteobacteria bacterium]|nr:dTDP-4-dehydrorhamnose reductase [Alphaproteobacteria bacterium]